MRAVRRSPLFRIALLILVGLCAHTVRANTRPIVPVRLPCPGKVAVAQPDPEKKLPPGSKSAARPGHLPEHLVYGHHLFGGSFGLASAQAAGLLPAHTAVQVAARSTISIIPQRRLFALRL